MLSYSIIYGRIGAYPTSIFVKEFMFYFLGDQVYSGNRQQPAHQYQVRPAVQGQQDRV